ncbi:MAG: hypothetical protein ACI8UO_005037 [Verrucomicrobiales bacterium]|jgi:hypothetical protein
MAYQIESIELFVRPLPPGRARFVIGKAGRAENPKTQPATEKPAPVEKRRPNGFLICKMTVLDDATGKRVVGMSGDRPSAGWLDKRKDYDGPQRLERLLEFVSLMREVYLDDPEFTDPFEKWGQCYDRAFLLGMESDHEELTMSFCSALYERAMIDAVCRLHDKTIFEMLKTEQLLIDPGAFFEELQGVKISKLLPDRPEVVINIRHTIGLADPLAEADLPPELRINDGEPETLEAYVKRDGLRFFKAKISGDVDTDFARLEAIWSVLAQNAEIPVITLDGNESYEDISAFSAFISKLEMDAPGLFDHISFIEQPLTRKATHNGATTSIITKLGAKKPLVIDEADGNPAAFLSAFEIGYRGVSHKNCKGFIKSLINLAWVNYFRETTGEQAFMSGEDLSVMPLVPLHQDFAALGVLGINQCERNGHHYSFGLSHLTAHEKALTMENHPELYVERNGELFLDIRDGQILCPSLHLQGTGFGIKFEPDWDSLIPFEDWKPA